MKAFAFFDELAEALLLELSTEAIQDRAQQQLRAFADALAQDRSIKDVLSVEIIRAALMRLEPAVVNALCLLLQHGEIDHVSEFIQRFERLRFRKGLAQSVTFRSAVPLTETDRRALIKQLEDRWKMHVVLEEKIDPAVIGGFKLQTEDWEYDGSVRGRLERLVQTLKA